MPLGIIAQVNILVPSSPCNGQVKRRISVISGTEIVPIRVASFRYKSSRINLGHHTGVIRFDLLTDTLNWQEESPQGPNPIKSVHFSTPIPVA